MNADLCLLIKGDRVMAVQGEPKQRSYSRKSRHPHGRESQTQSPSASVDKKGRSSLLQHLGALLGKLSISLGILLVLLCLALWLFSGYVLGKLSPEYIVTVQPFEISPETGKGISLSGKGASDIVVDILNDAASHAAQFHGTDYYSIDVVTGAQLVSLHQAIKVPIQTSYGIELKGISVDSILHLYDQARYDQWIIGGDVVSSPQGLVGKIRLNNADTAKSWETPPSAHANPSDLVREATYLMLAKEVPELLGQSYLQQAKYDAAKEVFRQWALDDPQNWKPSYYLSLAYSYQNKGQEASSLANWANNIAGNEKNSGAKKGREARGSEKEAASDLSQITKVVLQTKGASDPDTLETLQHTLATMSRDQSRLSHLFKSKATNADYQIQRARVLDKLALVESDRHLPTAYDRSRQAVDSIDEAIENVAENGGLHEQRAILLLHLVDIMKKQGRASEDIRKKENEEVKEYTRALEFRPTEDSALWGAVYAQIDLGNGGDAVDLARTITLLRPDSRAACAAYIVALELAVNTPGFELEREKEVEARLKQFLQSKPDQSQLLAVWNALMTNNDRKNLDLVATAAIRLFPENSTFGERKLQRYLVGLPRYDSQTGS
jgi:tetratricopeptide (TPR) repeat protein